MGMILVYVCHVMSCKVFFYFLFFKKKNKKKCEGGGGVFIDM